MLPQLNILEGKNENVKNDKTMWRQSGQKPVVANMVKNKAH